MAVTWLFCIGVQVVFCHVPRSQRFERRVVRHVAVERRHDDKVVPQGYFVGVFGKIEDDLIAPQPVVRPVRGIYPFFICVAELRATPICVNLMPAIDPISAGGHVHVQERMRRQPVFEDAFREYTRRIGRNAEVGIIVRRKRYLPSRVCS